MGRMIPPHWHDETPHSEQRVFNLLKNDPLSGDWVILHSLALKQSGTQPYGEVDFVVLIPGAGIICIEVKGGRVACTNGTWTTTDQSGATFPLKRSPYAQAQQGMHEVRRSLEEGLARAPEFYKAPFGYIVVFTDVEAPPAEIGVQPWETVDRHGLNSGFGALLLKAAKHQRARLHITSTPAEPQPALVRRIRDLLRPDFERVVARGTIIGDSERRLLELTEEQYELLDLLGGNSRCMFEGAAGTGKTLLALEFARRCAREGDHVLLVCFNRLLGDWLGREIAATTPLANITAGRFYKCLREVIMLSPIADEFRTAEQSAQDESLFGSVYPLYGQLALDSLEHRYDVIVMDEAQDLLRNPVLDLLDLWVRGGIREGRWAFFGDFHRQAIYRPTGQHQPQEQMQLRCGSYARASLKQNCRNTRRIGEETALLSGFDSPPYRMGQVDGAPVDYTEYTDTASQREALESVLTRLCAEPDLRPDDVVILSRNRFEQSVASTVVSGAFRIQPVDRQMTDHRIPTFRFATAHAFKGMESKIVVLCDVDHIQSDEDCSLLYVAMSRARSLLTVLLHIRTKNAVREAFRKKMSELWR